jgi:hypothetical protein
MLEHESVVSIAPLHGWVRVQYCLGVGRHASRDQRMVNDGRSLASVASLHDTNRHHTNSSLSASCVLFFCVGVSVDEDIKRACAVQHSMVWLSRSDCVCHCARTFDVLIYTDADAKTKRTTQLVVALCKVQAICYCHV